MSDIVERLRELEAVESELACECDCPPEATANYRYAMTCAEAADTITALRAENERLRAALTPSAETKAAYIGEFHFTEESYDEDGQVYYRKVAVPWTIIKEIMAAISARAALEEKP